jgi:hypothetical protein
VLVRDIPGAGAGDAIGPYPIFACEDWSALRADIEGLKGELVALSLVTDPFASVDEALLRTVFPDLCLKFKEHHLVDLSAPQVSEHHRRNARTAGKAVAVREADPASMLEQWLALYDVLIARHGITGPQRFSRGIFERQLQVAGMRALVAEQADEVVGMTLWLAGDEAVYYHLGAYSDAGYALKASFALFEAAIERFAGKARWLSLGAGAGLASEEDGLTRFKRGWSGHVRPTYLCGAILDHERYAALSAGRTTAYFPAYRAGEFG